jgi:hypothetical protein
METSQRSFVVVVVALHQMVGHVLLFVCALIIIITRCSSRFLVHMATNPPRCPTGTTRPFQWAYKRHKRKPGPVTALTASSTWYDTNRNVAANRTEPWSIAILGWLL